MSRHWETIYAKRKTTLEKALQVVKRGCRVFLGTACAEPQYLVQGLIDRADSLSDVQILHFIALGNKSYTAKRFDNRFRHNALFVGPNTRDAINEARADYTPIFISQIPQLLRSGVLPIDIALIQTSPPDRHGFLSLGISVDIVKAAVESAPTVIAQVNPRMPRTIGDTFVPIEKIAYIVEHEDALVEFSYPEPDDVVTRIGQNVAKLVKDGDTIHVGFGHISTGVLNFLKEKKDLGVHTEVVSDALIELINNGVVTGERKSLHPGKVVCSFCIGTEETYAYVNDNPQIIFFPAEYVYNPLVIAQNERLISIGSALEVDLSGQVCSESMGYYFHSGLGGRLDFIRGAAMSREGKSVIALPSTTKDGKRSLISSHLQEGAGVVATRGDVQYVVTEYGIAYLHGKSIRERAMSLINIAHPQFRKGLLEEAKKRAYIYPDQIFINTQAHTYPEQEESKEILSDNAVVTIRPINPTDEPLIQQFFYSHSDETVYRRYFRSVRAMPHATAQTLVNVDYHNRMAFVATLGEIGFERIVGVGRYATDDNHPDMVEVAYTIHEDCQRVGLGSILQDRLEDYAEQKGFRGASAYIIQDNHPMLKMFAKRGSYEKETFPDGIVRVWRRFRNSDKR